MECVFCAGISISMESEFSKVVFDSFPVSENHLLIIPKRHVEDAFELREDELLDLFYLAKVCKTNIMKSDSSVKGFNLGFNIGTATGQTVFHVHLHLIPRREGDTPQPRGGIRNVIAGKGDYQNE